MAGRAVLKLRAVGAVRLLVRALTRGEMLEEDRVAEPLRVIAAILELGSGSRRAWRIKSG